MFYEGVVCVGEGVVCGGGGVAVGVRVWCFTSLKVGLRSRIQVFVLVFMLRALTSRILCERVGRVWCVWVCVCGWVCRVGVVCGVPGEGVVVGVRMWYACVCKNFVLLMNFVLQFMCSTLTLVTATKYTDRLD